MHTYQARWTCQCGETGIEKSKRETPLLAGAMAVWYAYYTGKIHQKRTDCEEIGVLISEHGEAQDE
jgi:ribosomal protein S27AE